MFTINCTIVCLFYMCAYWNWRHNVSFSNKKQKQWLKVLCKTSLMELIQRLRIFLFKIENSWHMDFVWTKKNYKFVFCLQHSYCVFQNNHLELRYFWFYANALKYSTVFLSISTHRQRRRKDFLHTKLNFNVFSSVDLGAWPVSFW